MKHIVSKSIGSCSATSRAHHTTVTWLSLWLICRYCPNTPAAVKVFAIWLKSVLGLAIARSPQWTFAADGWPIPVLTPAAERSYSLRLYKAFVWRMPPAAPHQRRPSLPCSPRSSLVHRSFIALPSHYHRITIAPASHVHRPYIALSLHVQPTYSTRSSYVFLRVNYVRTVSSGVGVGFFVCACARFLKI